MKQLKTKYTATLASVMTVAGVIAVAYFGGAPEETGESAETVMKAGDVLGFCDVYYLQPEKPEIRDAMHLVSLADGRKLWVARLRNEKDCKNAPAFGKYIGSTPKELRDNAELASKFQKRTVKNENGESVEISDLPVSGDIHKWCCE